MDLQLLTPLCMIVLLFAFGTFLQRFSIPPIWTQTLVVIGFLISPLSVISFEFPVWALESLLFIVLFYVGVQTPASEFGKEALRALPASIGATAVAIVSAFGVSFWLGYSNFESAVISLIVGAIASASLLNIMEKMNLVKTEVAKAAVGIAIVNNLLLLLALSALSTSSGVISLAIKAGYSFGWLILVIGVARYIYPRVVKALNISSTEATLSALLVQALFFATVAHLLGLSFMLGAFVSALFVKEEYLHGDVHIQIRKGFHALTYLVAVPLLLLASTQFLAIDMSNIVNAAILAVSVAVAQYIVTYFVLWFKHYGRAQSAMLAFTTLVRSEMAFVLLIFSAHLSLITPAIFTMLLLSLLILTIITPFILRMGLAKLQSEEPYRSLLSKGSK